MDLINQKEQLLSFLTICDISCSSLDQLNGLEIDRNIFLDLQRYKKAKEHILTFKNIYSSSYLTSLQSNAPINQKWPLINLFRQIFKANGYQMTPKRKAAGYNKDGIKKYRRLFVVKKK
tara:strand:- start:794 stop:1150 length:357 start_codon:yes stop_codon:yes gene_type:complete